MFKFIYVDYIDNVTILPKIYADVEISNEGNLVEKAQSGDQGKSVCYILSNVIQCFFF